MAHIQGNVHSNIPSKEWSLCVFCGSSLGKRPSYAEAAKQLGIYAAQHDITLVYGGGDVGLMGVVAEAAMSNGGKVIGIIPQRLYDLVDQQALSELLVVKDMRERKALMEEKADAFLCLPGGIGTMEELFEVWSWRYIGYHQKPVALLNIDTYYDHLIALLMHMVDEGFLHEEIFKDLLIGTDIDVLLEGLHNKIGTAGAVPFLKTPERRVHQTKS